MQNTKYKIPHTSPIISLIAAIDEQRGLGKNNQLLFKIPEDLKRFRDITRNHVIIMGRKTFESIGRALPDRMNIVITRDKNFKANGITVVHSLDEALVVAPSYGANREIFIIGGGEIYNQAIDKADKLYLTVVKGTYDADTFFPDYSAFTKTRTEQGNDPSYQFTFFELAR